MACRVELLLILVLGMPTTAWSGAAATTPMMMQQHCQAQGSDLRAQKTKDGSACLTLCQETPDCGGFYHVSGWGQCFLKKAKVRTSSLRIFSGAVREDQGQRRVVDAAYDQDYSGKDLRRVVKVPSGVACGQECVRKAQCHAFAYFEGLQDCWLKRAEGRPYGKVFTCGSREAN